MTQREPTEESPRSSDLAEVRIRDEERRRREWAPYYRAKWGILVVGGVVCLLLWFLRNFTQVLA